MDLAKVYDDCETGRDILAEPINKVLQMAVSFTTCYYACLLVCIDTGKDWGLPRDVYEPSVRINSCTARRPGQEVKLHIGVFFRKENIIL